MSTVCPKCRRDNPESASFCCGCGTALAGPRAPGGSDESVSGAGLASRFAAAPGTTGDAGGDKTLWTGRASYLARLGRWIVWAVIAVVLLVWMVGSRSDSAGRLAGTIRWLTWAGVLVSGAYLAAEALYLRWAIEYRVTEQRLFIARGLLWRTTDQTELIRVDDVRVRQSPIQRLLGLGDVVVISTTDATDGRLVLRGIAAPFAVAEHVRGQMRRLRQQRGLYIEQV